MTLRSLLAGPPPRRPAWNVLLAAFVLASTLLGVGPAYAQETPGADPADSPATGAADADSAAEPAAERTRASESSEIEEIVVLGAESETASDFEAADSVTGFGAEDLAALGAQDIADLAEFTPNLEIVTSGATTPTFFIRGVGLNDFNANSTGAVAIYQDDVALNAPALQLGALYDVEAVNILRGPQGTGLARNASAGAIKIYSRKPSGEFGGYLRSELGNYDFRDFEGAIEAPIYDDLLAGRFAFRFSERDGTMRNRCGNAPPLDERVPVPDGPTLAALGKKRIDPPWSICGEPVDFQGRLFQPETWTGISDVATGLPSRVNDIGNWAARGTLLFQPTLDMTWLLNAHGSRRDEWSRLGQSYGVIGQTFDEDGNFTQRVLGGPQNTPNGYVPREVRERLVELAPCLEGVPGSPSGTCGGPTTPTGIEANDAKKKVANELAQELDDDPWAGDFNMCSDVDPDTEGTQCQKDFGRTINDTWGVFLQGDIALPHGLQLNLVSAYDTYDRLIDNDLDFSPDTLFQIRTDDDGWQLFQDLRLQGAIGDEAPVRWDVGGWFLRERLNVTVTNELGDAGPFGVGTRSYTQDLWSAAGYLALAFDFWERFTLDGGFRYNWERKTLDYLLVQDAFQDPLTTDLEDDWSAPTGTVRLTYRFREDTHVFWKYTRGWKPGTYNATSAVAFDFDTGLPFVNVSVASPETIDAFETGVRGSWLEGRLGVDLSFFYYAYQDYQIFTAQQFADGTPEFVILNADDSVVYGAELDAVARPWIGAFLNVRFGWLESQFLDFVQLQQEVVSGQRIINREINNTGNRLLNSPRFKVSLTAEQMVPLGRWGSITGRYDGVWTDESYFDATESRGIPNNQGIQFYPQGSIGQPAFWLHNLRLSYRIPSGQVELAGWVRNLANTPYKTFAFDGSTFQKTSIYFVGDPRTYGGTLTVTF